MFVKKIIVPAFVQLVCMLLVAARAQSQLKQPALPDSLFSTYYHQRVTHFRTLPQTKGDIIFLGNSITDGAEWSELFADLHVKNRGISGDITAGVINRIDEMTQRKPAKIFLLIGVNDLSRNITPDSVVKNILWITAYVRKESPSTQLYIQSILPVNDVYGKFGGHTGKGEQIKQVNVQLKQNAADYHYTFIDLYSFFCEDSEKLKAGLSNDGLHLKGEGYLLWKHLVYPYVLSLQAEPSLIPIPQQLKWEKGYFPLYACKKIIIRKTELQKEAERLQQYLSGNGLPVNISKKANVAEPAIELRLDTLSIPQLSEETYRLEITPGKVLLTANTPHGIFNGLQTLEQLMRDHVMIDACEITDWPAFSWRGYMTDVGRNFQSVELLKQQIEVMSKYKLNIFHLHLTEDIAWRLAIKQYPQLTAPENMLRNKGEYYSEEQLKELIIFCKERYIILIPEIDMPGHSAAFKRAMKTDMQTDTGMIILKNIIKEVCTTYDVPYLHIGADEIKITNENFIPELTAYIESFGKKIIGWQPGGNFTNNTIRQLWMDDNGKITANPAIQYIDSRHLYLNHFDPLESIVTIFNRKIGNKEKGDVSALGGTICLWNDRAVVNEMDFLRMNPVYPSMLAFAERTWRGGGHDGWTAMIGEPNSASANEFTEFENRLLDNKQQYFTGILFPYVKQSSNSWKLYGPYENEGNLSKKFGPELVSFDENKTTASLQAVGGTIVLRHWWFPLIKGLIKEPKGNTTWYATTKVWSDEYGYKNFWIGFNNLSRSPATDSPPVAEWDNKQSIVWVNGTLIEPPHWKRGGQKGNSEIPLTDEGYEYREPTKIFLQKGWNTVLVKAPVGSFNGTDWQNPVKWMFTFVPLLNK